MIRSIQLWVVACRTIRKAVRLWGSRLSAERGCQVLAKVLFLGNVKLTVELLENSNINAKIKSMKPGDESGASHVRLPRLPPFESLQKNRDINQVVDADGSPAEYRQPRV